MKKQFTLRFTPNSLTYSHIRKLASLNGRSINGYITWVLDQHLKQHPVNLKEEEKNQLNLFEP